MFEPTAELERDYLAYCEMQRRLERSDLLDSITTEKSAEEPAKGKTKLFVRSLGQCLTAPDMAPLTSAIPHCNTLPAVSFTAAGMTEMAYKLLIQAVWKSTCVMSVRVDFNSPNSGLLPELNPTIAMPRRSIAVTLPPEVAATPYEWLLPSEAAGGFANAAPEPEVNKAASGKAAKPPAKKTPRTPMEESLPEPIRIPDGWHGILLTNIQDLSLRGNHITDDQLLRLTTVLATHQHLLCLNLWGNDITDTGANHVAEMLRANRKLTALNLGNNRIGDHGAAALAKSFRPVLVDSTKLVEVRSKVRQFHPAVLPDEPPAYPTYEELERQRMAEFATLGSPRVRDDKKKGSDKPRTATGKRGSPGDGGLRSSVLWDCDVIRMWGGFHIIPGNQSLWSFNVSHNMAMTDAAAQSFADIFSTEQTIQSDMSLNPLSARDEGDGGEGKDAKNKTLRKPTRDLRKQEDDGMSKAFTTMLQETPVSQWPVYGIGESGCSTFSLEHFSVTNHKMSPSAIQLFQTSFYSWRQEMRAARPSVDEFRAA
eukprot:GGOE01018584.1.p1 GENE.GGOE01018584.1~~GGOE01018584.1.p1  ORF type:complete len:558 (+),score=142.03 GGOE01018584.1:62-1675(+)